MKNKVDYSLYKCPYQGLHTDQVAFGVFADFEDLHLIMIRAT